MRKSVIVVLVVLVFGGAAQAQMVLPPADADGTTAVQPPPLPGTIPPVQPVQPSSAGVTAPAPAAGTQSPAATMYQNPVVGTQPPPANVYQLPPPPPDPLTTPAPMSLPIAMPEEDKTYADILGTKMLLGGAGIVITGDDGAPDQYSARLAGGVEIFFNHYFGDAVGFHMGFGIVGKGWKVEEEGYTEWVRMLHLEIPIGLRFRFAKVVRLGLDLVPSIQVSGKYKVEYMGQETEGDIEDVYWDNYRRFNLDPRIQFGFGVPIGRVALTFGVSWQMDLINNYDPEEDLNAADYAERYMNVMGYFGVEVGL